MIFFSFSYHSFWHAGQTEGGKLGLFLFGFFFYNFRYGPRNETEIKQKGKQNGARCLPRLPVWPGSCASCLISSKGKIAKRVVWMIALAGCAQAGWIARGTRPEQGEPIYILCNSLFHVHVTTHLVVYFFFVIHLVMLVGDVRKCTFTVYIICISISVLFCYLTTLICPYIIYIFVKKCVKSHFSMYFFLSIWL